MMDLYKMQLDTLLSQVANYSVKLDESALDETNVSFVKAFRKMIEEDPTREFSLRMSSIGRPLCQLKMEKAKTQRLPNDTSFPIKMLFGAMIEASTIMLLRHAGFKIDDEQLRVSLTLSDGTVVHGTLDIIMNDAVWDIKSASDFAFQHKFASYYTLKEEDTFGYLPQLYGYAKAVNKKAGGWIVINKSTGEIKFIYCPEQQEEESRHALAIIESNVAALKSDEEFKRCFDDKEEVFNRKLTGNRILSPVCTYCPFKYACWDNLQHLPVPASKAMDRPYAYYTKVVKNENS